jgi:hypothetical protein
LPSDDDGFGVLIGDRRRPDGPSLPDLEEEEIGCFLRDARNLPASAFMVTEMATAPIV